MPGFYADGEYDLSGFAVGIVKRDSVIDGKNIEAGAVLLGLPSSGVHSNGFSFVNRSGQMSIPNMSSSWAALKTKYLLTKRMVYRVLAQSGHPYGGQNSWWSSHLGGSLDGPNCYISRVLDLMSQGGVKGIVHITGGGFTDNIPRIFPKGLGAVIDTNSWTVPPVFRWIREVGRINDGEMRRTFNVGIGMVLMVTPKAALTILRDANGRTPVYQIREVVRGEGTSYQWETA